MGWKTVDGDPSNGQPNEACMTFLSYVTAANNPPRLPNRNVLSKPGAQEKNALITEYYVPSMHHVSLVNETFAAMHAKTLKTPNSSALNEFRSLLLELGYSAEEIRQNYIPDTSGGLSEVAQLEMISKFMVGNPAFMLKLQTEKENIQRVRTLLRSISLRLDDGISDMVADKGRHMAAINGLLLRDDRERANSTLQLIADR